MLLVSYERQKAISEFAVFESSFLCSFVYVIRIMMIIIIIIIIIIITIIIIIIIIIIMT